MYISLLEVIVVSKPLMSSEVLRNGKMDHLWFRKPKISSMASSTQLVFSAK